MWDPIIGGLYLHTIDAPSLIILNPMILIFGFERSDGFFIAQALARPSFLIPRGCRETILKEPVLPAS